MFDRQSGAVRRSRTSVRVDPAERFGEQVYATGQGTFVAQIQQEFPDIRKRYCGVTFGRGVIFCLSESGKSIDVFK
jgi:hypothetical protein